MSGQSIDLRLVIPAAVVWAVALVIVPLPRWQIAVAVGAWVLCAAALGWMLLRPPGVASTLRRRRLNAALSVVALCAAAVGVLGVTTAVREPLRRPPEIVALANGHAAADLTVVVSQAVATDTGKPQSFGTGSPRTHYAATLVRADIHRVSAPVLVFDAEPPQRVGIGATLAFTGKLALNDPGDDVSFLVFGDTTPRVVEQPPWYLAWADALRVAFSSAADDLPGDGALLEPGLAIGDVSLVTDELSDAMKASSLSHLTAVSGANCAIIVALAMLGGAALRLGRTWRIVLSLVALAGFVVLVTPGASVVRAAVMATLVLLALASGRPLRGLPVLGLAVLVLLIGDPWLASNYGFALSVLATGGLLVLASPLARLLARWMPLWLAATLAVPLAAQLACQPVLVMLNPTVSLLGIVANTLAAPAAPVATVVGLVACVLLPFLPPIGEALLWVAWLPAAWIAAIARFFASATWAMVPWPGGAVGAVVLAAITTVLLIAVLSPILRRTRATLVFLAACGLVGMLATAGGAAIAARMGRPADWQVAACDIGQGDAMVVRSAGRIALVDTGPEPARLSVCLRELGISRIDLLVLSHYDLDHVGGVSAVFGKVTTALVGPPDGEADESILRQLSAGGARVLPTHHGDVGSFGQLTWRVLWPPEPLGAFEPGNDASVTIDFRPRPDCNACVSSLFVGDLGEEAQDAMLALNPGLAPVQVLEVAHHGSSDQSEALYRTAGAAVGLIGVGVDNGYGHPTGRLLEILRATGTETARTDTDGLLLVAPAPRDGVRPAASALIVWRTHADVGAPG